MAILQHRLLRIMLVCSNIIYVLGRGVNCPSNHVRCGNRLTCVDNQRVCDGNKDCDDGSDEVPLMCQVWHVSSRCSRGQVYKDNPNKFYGGASGACTVFTDYCNNNRYGSSTIIGKTCQIVVSQQLPPVKSQVKRSVLTSGQVDLLSAAVNSTLHHETCPMLYTHLGNHCVAFFSLAQVPWPEARQFCKSIYGDLISFDDINFYGNIHEYLKENQLTTDYWLGGRYDMDSNGWTWLDDSPMPLGSPYWAERYSSSCVPRALPSGDPFNGPDEAPPGAPCYNYLQAPKQRTLGYCAAITYEHFYYVSDEECTSQRSPLCVLNTAHNIG
ncbi:unnamed protein product [Meganyctiphanes norvegica]|uniref:C-type lectin domain-containing protein n=1 Tax=Meganyctiphanes norvegica TaxID=48144 RepID=A0AAV2RT90_MEGNR